MSWMSIAANLIIHGTKSI